MTVMTAARESIGLIVEHRVLGAVVLFSTLCIVGLSTALAAVWRSRELERRRQNDWLFQEVMRTHELERDLVKIRASMLVAKEVHHDRSER
jgi:hypothetical protein